MSTTAMTGAYISGGELHISLDSASYSGYCDYLRQRLKDLEEQKKSLEESINEIHKILNPPTIILDCDDDIECGDDIENDMYMFDQVHKSEHLQIEKKEDVILNETTGSVTLTLKDIPEASPKEKYLLVCDIARRYKTTEACVIDACGKGAIPCHRVGDEYRFTPSDCERLSSLVARRQVFTPAPAPTPAAKTTVVKTTVVTGLGRTMSATKAYEMLDINWYGAQKLREKGLLTGKRDEDGQFWYDEKEVLALKSTIKKEGGIANLLQSLNKPKGMLTCGEILKMLNCSNSDYDSLKRMGFLKSTKQSAGRGRGSYCLFSASEVEALADMVKAEGGIKPFLAKARAN